MDENGDSFVFYRVEALNDRIMPLLPQQDVFVHCDGEGQPAYSI